MISVERIERLLRHRGRRDLAALLSRSYVQFDESTTFGSYWNSILTTVEVYSPVSDYDRLKTLSQEDEQVLMDAILEIWPPKANDMEINAVVFRLDPDSLTESRDEAGDVLRRLDDLRNTMIAVSTGGPRINDVNDEYKSVYTQSL